jgi:hypothetical protein
MSDESVEFDERAWIEEKIQSLSGREFVVLMLLVDSILPAA